MQVEEMHILPGSWDWEKKRERDFPKSPLLLLAVAGETK